MRTIEIAWSAAWVIESLDELLSERVGPETAERRRARLAAALQALAQRDAAASVISRLSPEGRPLREEQIDGDLTVLYERRPGGIRVVAAFASHELVGIA